MSLNLDIDKLHLTLDTSVRTANTLVGHDDPNFRRIHHHNHHIALYIKDYIMQSDCKSYFEIGTHFGHSLCNILQSKYRSKIVSCDLFLRGQSIANDCLVEDIEALANQNVQKFNIHNYDAKILKGSSYSQKMHSKVKEEFPNGIDLLFIDGDHSYKGVSKDFDLYFPLVNKGGFIVFDDYLPLTINNKKRECPVAIDELVSRYKSSINIIGLIDDTVGCNQIKKYDSDQNFDFIIQKK